ncbi:unnamed protein product [Pleuronectes platessa]|uniref:Uncharacterized protein n=1 Tax=Pleuronectes platessa TaxID=8262 RepID=A0A9N7Z8Z2_PLEPL|nr:unnamed protein product [Pleuronectes platessa]
MSNSSDSIQQLRYTLTPDPRHGGSSSGSSVVPSGCGGHVRPGSQQCLPAGTVQSPAGHDMKPTDAFFLPNSERVTQSFQQQQQRLPPRSRVSSRGGGAGGAFRCYRNSPVIHYNMNH